MKGGANLQSLYHSVASKRCQVGQPNGVRLNFIGIQSSSRYIFRSAPHNCPAHAHYFHLIYLMVYRVLMRELREYCNEFVGKKYSYIYVITALKIDQRDQN